MWQLVRVDRRHGRGLPRLRHPGRRRQRQPLQREPRPRHRPDARSSASSAWSTASTQRPPGVRLVDGGTAPRARARGPLAGRVPLGVGARPPRRRRPPPSTSTTTPRSPALVRNLVAEGLVAGVHDAADGLGVALAEMAVRSGRGFHVSAAGRRPRLAVRRVRRAGSWLCVANGHGDAVVRAAQAAGVAATRLGTAGGDRLVVEGLLDVALADAVAAWRGRLPDAIGSGRDPLSARSGAPQPVSASVESAARPSSGAGGVAEVRVADGAAPALGAVQLGTSSSDTCGVRPTICSTVRHRIQTSRRRVRCCEVVAVVLRCVADQAVAAPR